MKIAKNSVKFLIITIFSLFSLNLSASNSAGNNDAKIVGQVDTKEEVQEYIQHHLQDSYDFTFFTDGETGKHYGFSLPVILIDDGVQVFMSSKFDHGNKIAENNGNYYKLYHGKIYKTDSNGTINYDKDHHVTNKKPLNLSITKSVLGILLTALLMFWMFGSLAKEYKKNQIPTGFGRFLEPLILYVRDDIAKPNIGDKKYKKYMGFLLTIFFFIWILNLLGMTPLGFNVTGQIAVTACLALFTVIIYLTNGTKAFWGHTLWMPGVPVFLRPILAVIELVGFLLIKPFSLLVRLFANITAGHVVMMSLASLIVLTKSDFTIVGSTAMAVFLSLFIAAIELLVAFLQAFIFTMLSSLFIGMAVGDDHH